MVEELHIKHFKKDLLLGGWKEEEIPTDSIKKATRASALTADTNLSSHCIAGTSNMRLTYLRVSADQASEFRLTDRDGTVDYVYLEAAGAEVLQGGPNTPIHVLKGSFNVTPIHTISAGTFHVAWEGIK